MVIKLCQLLAAVAIFAATAAAQRPLLCIPNTGVPPIVRAEGVAEEVSQIVINCTGGTPIAAGQPLPKLNIEIIFNTNVSSRLLDPSGSRSEALLLLDEPTPAEQIEAPAVPFAGTMNALGGGIYKGAGRPNVFGSTASMNSLQWSNIPFDPPGDSQSRVIRLVNMRANANQLGVGSSMIPNTITGFISITGGPITMAIQNPHVTVAYIQRGLAFTASPAIYNQCQPGTETYSVSFAELFGTAFRHKSAAGSQNVPGWYHNTESMFYNTAFTGIGAGAGVATQGTRLSVRFVNVPANVTITAPTAASSTAGDAAALVASGTDGSTADPVTGVVTLIGGVGAAVYEVTASNPGAISTLTFAVSIAHAANPLPGLGTATVAGNYAPIAMTYLSSREAAPRFIENPTSASTFTMETCSLPVTLSLNRTALAFAATNGATATPPQEVFLTMAGASNNWTASSNAAWLAATPSSGKGSGRFNVGLVPSALPAPGSYTGTVTVNATGATNGPLAITCTLTVKASATAPFGSFDTPVDRTTGVTGSIAVTGWALDDIAVKKVTIWRDRVGTEPVYPNGLVYIGDALFVPGARPDVETKYPTYPAACRAGWGYLMLTYGLPAQGNGTFKIHAIAVDQEGKETLLGSRTITVDNLHAVKPFGALDLPQPGETISGLYPVQGWALTPQPARIEPDGSTIWVHIDGVNIAHPGELKLRDDIFAIFPGYANSTTSAGSYAFNSTAYANGMHNIAWILSDNLGRVDGIGSRFFNIWNETPAPTAAPQPVQLRVALPTRHAAPASADPTFRLGYDPETALTPIRQAGEGLLESVALDELGRIELHLPAGHQWTAALRFGDELRDLPIGSTFDAEGGIFYWQLGPGFLGEFNLEFRTAGGTVLPILVRVGARGSVR